MSHLPMMLNLADDLNRLTMMAPYDPSHLYHRQPAWLMPRDHHYPALHAPNEIIGSRAVVGKDGFQVCMDVTQFKPSELNVKVADNHIVVEGSHEEREDDHGYISRHFKRRYTLPKGYDAEKVLSTLSSDGVLTVSVPKPQLEDKAEGRIVQIQQVGPAHLNVKPNSKETEKIK